MISSLRFFLPKRQYIEWELASEGHQGAHEVGGRAQGGAPPPSWAGCGPPGLHLLRGFFFIFSKVFRGVSGHSENFYFLHKKQHHGSSAENKRQSGLVPFISYKLESKTRAKVFGKVDTMETYHFLTCTPSSLDHVRSKNHALEGFIPFGPRLIFLFFEILK